MKERFLYINTILWFTLFVDQVTKRMAEHLLTEEITHSFLYDILRIQYIKNTGAFLSFGSNFSPLVKLILFIYLPLIALIGGVLYLIFSKNLNKYNITMFSLIIGGGFGNLIDRILEGKVTDFLNLGIGQLRTGIWNMADFFIMIGAIGLFLHEIKKEKKSA